MIATLFFLASCALASGPKIEKIEGHFYLDIGKAAQDLLRRHDPYFTVWTEPDFMATIRTRYKPSPAQTLSGVVADFNGDRVKDLAVMGRNREHNLILAVLSELAGGYKVIEVDRAPVTDPKRSWLEGPKDREPGLWTFLSHVKPGWVSSQFERKAISLKHEAFRVEYFDKGAVVYYLKDGQFQKYTTSD